MIVVHTYGKVASTTLHETVAAAFPQSSFFTHCMQAPLRTAAERFCVNHADTGVVEEMLREGQRIWSTIGETRLEPNPDITILTGVREPIGRSLSLVMQTLSFAFADCTDHNEAMIASRLAERLTHIWCDGALTHHDMQLPEYLVKAPLVWLKDELEDPFGLDVRAATMTKDRPYRLLKHDGIRFLLYRQEEFASQAQTFLSELFSSHAFQVARANDGAQKSTAAIYMALRQSFKLPYDRLKLIYDNPYVASFYPKAEVEALMERWGK